MAVSSPPDDGHIYIDELCRIIDRVPATVRMWEREGLLPRHLLPKRGWRKWRCWTHGQVHGARGILAWMERNNMRPGNQFDYTNSNESEHVAALRKPKYLSDEQLEMARQWAHNRNWYIEQIVEELLPVTRYQSAEGLQRVLVKAFKQKGWNVPPSALVEQREKERKKNLSQTRGARAMRASRARRKARAAAA